MMANAKGKMTPGQLKNASIYSVKGPEHVDGADVYSIVKMSVDYEFQAEYKISESSRGGLTCTCPAHKRWCRHMDMLRLFQAEEAINSRMFYNFNADKWIKPISNEPESESEEEPNDD